MQIPTVTIYLQPPPQSELGGFDMSERSHFRPLACLYSSLQAHLGQDARSYVTVQTPLHYDEEHPAHAKQPDLMVVQGAGPQERNTYKLWEEGQTPNVIFEITSGESWLDDLVNKSALYMQLGVKEYIIFDPQGEFLQEQIQGLRLVKRQGRPEYVAIARENDGTLYSEELAVHLAAKEQLLRLLAGENKTLIPWATELQGVAAPTEGTAGADSHATAALQEAQAELADARNRLQQVEERARQNEEQAKRNGQETQRLKTLEAENAHLRVLLGQMQGTKVMR